MTIEERLNKIKGEHREELVNHDTRKRLAKEMAEVVNEFYPIPDNQLEQEGMMPLGQLLSKEQVADIHKHMSDKLVYNSHVPKGPTICQTTHP